MDFYIDTFGVKRAFFIVDDMTFPAELMNPYRTVLLESEGFDTVDIITSNEHPNWVDAMAWIDEQESPTDKVFLFFGGHGLNFGESYIYYSANSWYFSGEMAAEVDKLESTNIFILVEACNSGTFRDDLMGSGRFVITTTDYDNFAYYYSTTNIPIFTNFFFNAVNSNYLDMAAYNYAKAEAQNLHSDQNPMCSDLNLYTWFGWGNY